MMNYSASQDQSSTSNQSQNQTQNQNFLKIKSIWKNIEQVKNIQEDQTYKTSHKKPSKQQPFSINKSKHLRHIQSLQKEQPQPLQIKLKKCEKQLQKSKQNTNILMKKLTQAEQQIQYLQYELEKQTKQKMQALQYVEQLQQQNQLQMKESQQMLKQKSYQKQNKYARQNLQNQNQLSKKVRTKQKIIDRLQLKIKSLELEIKNKDKEVQSLANQIDQLRLKCKNKNKDQNSFNQIAFQGAQLLQLNQAYKTIERLVKLLKSTQQYKLLANFAEQVKSIHFLQTIQKRLKNNTLNHKIIQKSACNCMQVNINQRLIWTPMMCYKKMLQMKIKYETLNQSCIEEVLFEMNKIYLSKQESRVVKLKQYYEAQINKIKKKYTETYDQMLAKKQIQRLKKELSGKNKNITIQGTNKKSNQGKLKSLGQYEDQIRLKEKQIKLLQQRVRLMETQTNSYQKSLYLQGVLWIIDKTLEQLQINSQDLSQFETKFRQRIQSITSPQEWLMSYKQFFQSVNDLNSGLIDKILTLKENTLNKMSK